MGNIQFLHMEESVSSVPPADALAGFSIIRQTGTERYRHECQAFFAMGLAASALDRGDRPLLVLPAEVLKKHTGTIMKDMTLVMSQKSRRKIECTQ